MTKALPKDLTSYDLIKALALVLMVLDHVGHHFFPDEMWFRVLGRLCLPIWFFLIGYANTAQLSKGLWIGGGVVLASAAVAGQFLLPINILFTILALRYFREWTVLRTFHSAETMRGMFFILLFLYVPTSVLLEYGSLGMMMALFGFMVRHRDKLAERIEMKYLKLFAAAVFVTFYIVLGVAFPAISPEQAIFMGVGFAVIGIVLWFFKPVTFASAPNFMARSFITLFQFMGRRTLEIYVAHIVIFRGVAMVLYPEEYTFMNVQIAPPGMLAFFGLQ